MSTLFEELDYYPTPIGALTLRRRRDLKLNQDVFEIRLGDESLMTSVFTASEIALARLGLAALDDADWPTVVVGGLGLGYTANAVLEGAPEATLIVVEALAPVIEWHEKGVLPLGTAVAADPRCRLVQGDFFAMAATTDGFDPESPGRLFDLILVDIDHSPDALLNQRSATFYQPDGLRRLARHLSPSGVFGLWSDALPDETFLARLATVFAEAWTEPVTFHNPLQDRPFTQTVYLARTEQRAVP
jgi:spermidine synthase